jgi:hypothetical protein
VESLLPWPCTVLQAMQGEFDSLAAWTARGERQIRKYHCSFCGRVVERLLRAALSSLAVVYTMFVKLSKHCHIDMSAPQSRRDSTVGFLWRLIVWGRIPEATNLEARYRPSRTKPSGEKEIGTSLRYDGSDLTRSPKALALRVQERHVCLEASLSAVPYRPNDLVV